MIILAYTATYLGVSLGAFTILLLFDYEPDFDELHWYDRLALVSVVPLCLGLAAFEGGWAEFKSEAAYLFRLIVLGRVDG